MNNFERQEAIDELKAGYSKRELAAMVLDLTKRERKIKAEAVRELPQVIVLETEWVSDELQKGFDCAADQYDERIKQYAKKLEQNK